ncbi:helix-turn-helix domain-containing protein [Embleya hyalina]|uniref:helix-turn-helix domain-containing protein n=1 Tax=Embleya hyalina TaxID=516124 RepID=UPI00135CD57B|nr:helix-turn-helix domain-containing protein [Embleya hyalina]
MSIVTRGIVRISAVSHGSRVCRRTPAAIRRADPEVYLLALLRHGRQGVEQAHNHASLGPGDLVLVDSSRPFDVRAEDCDTASGSVLLQFPKRLLPVPEPRVARLLATPLCGTRGVGRLLARFMTDVADEPALYTLDDHARLGHVALDLAAAVVAHHADGEGAPASGSSQHVLFLRIVSFVDRHLHVPELSPAAIAAAHRISTRYLQRIFRSHGTSPSAYVRHRRLDRCRRDLADPAMAHLPVHAVAARWGFTRPAEFNRAFRTATGMPPGAYRVAAVAEDVPTTGTRPRPPTPVGPPGRPAATTWQRRLRTA